MNSNEVRYTLYRETLQCLLISSIFPDIEFNNEATRYLDNILNSSKIYIFTDIDPFPIIERTCQNNEIFQTISSEKIKHYVRWETNFSLQRIKELNLNSNCLIVIKKTPKTVKTDEMKECFKLLSTLNVPAVWSRQAK